MDSGNICSVQKLCEDLLLESKLESGQLELAKEHCPAYAYVHQLKLLSLAFIAWRHIPYLSCTWLGFARLQFVKLVTVFLIYPCQLPE